VGEVTHDIVSLAELQFELLRIDCREGLKRLLVPVALLLLAGIVALGTTPIVLILVAEFLVQSRRPIAGRRPSRSPRSAASIRGGGHGSCWGGSYMRGVVRVFERSPRRMTRNMTWNSSRH